jgi:DNA polymerase-4
MANLAPRICCLDLDTFFVSVERLLDPSLEGNPVIVGGQPGQRGVVTAASYEVRELGVRSGMSLTDAAKLAPDAIYLPTRHGIYGDYATRVRALLDRFCPLIQTASIDEFYLDFSGCERLLRGEGDRGDDEAIERGVREMARAVASEIGLPASAGIATSKAVSKIACGLAKPRGVLMVPAGREAAFLAPLPVRRYPGIGPVAERRLHAIGVTTLGQLAGMSSTPELRRIFGAWAEGIRRGARGEASHRLGDDRPAFKEHDPEGGVVGSISNERTFRADVGDTDTVEAMLCSLCERVCWRARKRGVQARTATLKLRYSDFHTLSRSHTMPPTSSELEVFPVIRELCRRAWTRRLPIRLLGVALSNLGFYDGQLGLFSAPLRDPTPLHRAVDEIRARFGFEAVALARGHGKSRRRARKEGAKPRRARERNDQ